MKSPLSWRKPLLCSLLGVGGALWYIWNLWGYLRSLQSPWPLFLAFMLSLVLGVVHETYHAFGRQALVEATTTIIGFAVAVLIAHQVRTVYLGLMSDMSKMPTTFMRDWLGADMMAAMMNRTVGYGGCYAFGVTLSRWLLHKRIRTVLCRYFVDPLQVQRCPHCNRPMENSL